MQAIMKVQNQRHGITLTMSCSLIKHCVCVSCTTRFSHLFIVTLCVFLQKLSRGILTLKSIIKLSLPWPWAWGKTVFVLHVDRRRLSYLSVLSFPFFPSFHSFEAWPPSLFSHVSVLLGSSLMQRKAESFILVPQKEQLCTPSDKNVLFISYYKNSFIEKVPIDTAGATCCFKTLRGPNLYCGSKVMPEFC